MTFSRHEALTMLAGDWEEEREMNYQGTSLRTLMYWGLSFCHYCPHDIISFSLLICDGEEVCAGQNGGSKEVTWFWCFLADASSWGPQAVVESSFLVFGSPENVTFFQDLEHYFRRVKWQISKDSWETIKYDLQKISGFFWGGVHFLIQPVLFLL